MLLLLVAATENDGDSIYVSFTFEFVGSWPPLITSLLYDDPPPSRSWQIAYKEFGDYQQRDRLKEGKGDKYNMLLAHWYQVVYQ